MGTIKFLLLLLLSVFIVVIVFFACVRYLVVIPFHLYLKQNSDINHFLLSFQLSMPIFVRCLVGLFLVQALFQPNKAGGMRHVGIPGLNSSRSPSIKVHYQREMSFCCLFKTLSQTRRSGSDVNSRRRQ